MAIPHRDTASLLRKHDYTEIKKIGEGSFGKAILVENSDRSKLVCKMVDVSQASARETQDAVKEGRLLSAFKHPYIVRYRESFIDNGWLCILMDYCEGGDLTKQIETAKKKGSRLPEEQVLRWITQALLALKYIHDKHVLHRDLKSGNFFLSRSGNLKMGDFGIAKVLSCTAACAKTQIGTPYYLSPEVCQEKPYTWPSDMWAMGCILYELLALKVPFDAPNISSLVQKICRGPTPQVPTAFSDFTRGLCTEMLARNPQNRPSAESILQRPRMQGIVKSMLEQAQAQPGQGHGDSSALHQVHDKSDGIDIRHDLAAGFQPQAVQGPYADSSGRYAKGDLVEYHSNTHRDWLPATVITVDGDGRIMIDLKPNTWIGRDAQASQVRPRRNNRSGDSHQHRAPVAGRGSPTPGRQRSPSVGRAMTPSRQQEPAWLGGGNGSRAGTPSRGGAQRRNQSPWDGRAGTPSRARDASPSRGGTPARDGGGPPFTGQPLMVPPSYYGGGTPGRGEVRPPGMPVLPRPSDGRPQGLDRPDRAARAAGMAIAGAA